MSEIRKSAKERETTGWQIALIGLIVIVFGVSNAWAWALIVGLAVAVIGGIMWGAGMARRD